MDEDEARNQYAEMKRTWREFLRLASEATNGTDAQGYISSADLFIEDSETLRYKFQRHFKRPIDDEDIYVGGPEPMLVP